MDSSEEKQESKIHAVKVLGNDGEGVLILINTGIDVCDMIRLPIKHDETKEQLIKRVLKQITRVYESQLMKSDFEIHHIDQDFGSQKE
jgi:hypothetical protein